MDAGYDVKFVEEPNVPLKTECPICHLILRTPCETTCCHNFLCKHCIEEYQRRGNIECPFCRKELDFREAPAIERVINQLKVYCKHQDEGCKWEGELGDLEKHLNENPSADNRDTGCDFTDVECPVCHDPVQRVDLSLHRSDECPNEEIQCSNHNMGCEWRGLRKRLPEHLNINSCLDQRFEGCGYVELSCKHECGRVIHREDLQQHEADCPLETVKCEFQIVGCEAEFLRKDAQDHLSRSNAHHMHLLCQDRLRFRQTIKNEQTAQFQGLSNDIQLFGSRIHNLQQNFGNDINLLNVQTENHQNNIEMLRTKHTDGIKLLKLKHKEDQENFENDINLLNVQTENHQHAIEMLRSKHTDDIKLLKLKHTDDIKSLKCCVYTVGGVGGFLICLIVVLIGLQSRNLPKYYDMDRHSLPKHSEIENAFASYPKLSEIPYLLPADYYVDDYRKLLTREIKPMRYHTFVPFAGVVPTRFYFTASAFIQDGFPALKMCFHKIGDSDSVLATTVYVQLVNQQLVKTHRHHVEKLNLVYDGNMSSSCSTLLSNVKEHFLHEDCLHIRILNMELGRNENPPFKFSSCHYHDVKQLKIVREFGPFYSSPGGFEFYMNIYLDGYGDGKGTHLSFFIYTSGIFKMRRFTGSIKVMFHTNRKDIEHTLDFSGVSRLGVTRFLSHSYVHDHLLEYDCIFFGILDVQVDDHSAYRYYASALSNYWNSAPLH